ncbi:FkbM family methyltransferase [Lacibacterium aquatile]|uniref:FkbM family methyltransferase n=1 Tax=Lacibacterium aquatile TaxID=1168082 RepID=A0ABW5DUB0_9PROT
MSLTTAALDDQDAIAGCELYLRRVYNDGNGDPATNGEWALIERCARQWQVVFDVGACVGDWSSRTLGVNPKAEVHCFEPFPPNVEALRKRVGQQAHILPVALGSEAGEAVFHVPSQTGPGENLGSLYPQGSGALVRLAVPMTTIADYCTDMEITQIDFLKIDAEGAEVSILEGARPLLEAGRIAALQFEYGGTWVSARHFMKDIFDLVAGTDYTVAKLMPDGCRIVADYFYEIESFRQSNWLLIRGSSDDGAAYLGARR